MRYHAIFAAFLLSIVGSLTMAANLAMADEALERKTRSIEELDRRGIPYLEHLPLLPNSAESPRRTTDEVVERALALMIVAVMGESGDKEFIVELTERFQAESYFTPDERAFINDPVDQQRGQMSWRYEAVHVLMWALGFLDELGSEGQITDVPGLATMFRELGAEGLRAQAELRPQSAILDAADWIYRLDWAVVNARVNGTEPPEGIMPGVVYERHYTLNWLIGYLDQEWDDISTDT